VPPRFAHPFAGLLISHAQAREVKLGRDESGPIKLYVHDPGYDLGFASTIHGVQGDTVQRLIVDLNRPTSGERVLNLHSVYTAWSRVRSGAHIRLAPWNPQSGRAAHLLRMRHDSNYVSFLRAYNEDGVFVADRVVQAAEPARQTKQQRARRELVVRPPARQTGPHPSSASGTASALATVFSTPADPVPLSSSSHLPLSAISQHALLTASSAWRDLARRRPRNRGPTCRCCGASSRRRPSTRIAKQ
jgi:hypothetical protein